MNSVIAIVLFLIILISLYKIYYIVNPDLLTRDGSIINLKQSPQLEIDVQNLRDPSGIRYFYDGWLMVNEIQSENVSHVIFNRGNDFVVSLKGHVLSIVKLKNGDTINKTTGTYNESNSTKLVDIATNFPFQKMVHFCINVDWNKMDVYLNGKIVKSINGTEKGVTFDTFEKSTTISIGSNYLVGRLARFRREAGNIDPPSVWANYVLNSDVSATDDTNSSDYSGKLTITKDSTLYKTINIF